MSTSRSSNPHIIDELEFVANGSSWAGDTGKEAIYQAIDVIHNIRAARADAERKAWASLAGYKFYMFGYWAAAWVKNNQLLPKDYKSANPFKEIVRTAKQAKWSLNNAIERCSFCARHLVICKGEPCVARRRINEGGQV